MHEQKRRRNQIQQNRRLNRKKPAQKTPATSTPTLVSTTNTGQLPSKSSTTEPRKPLCFICEKSYTNQCEKFKAMFCDQRITVIADVFEKSTCTTPLQSLDWIVCFPRMKDARPNFFANQFFVSITRSVNSVWPRFGVQLSCVGIIVCLWINACVGKRSVLTSPPAFWSAIYVLRCKSVILHDLLIKGLTKKCSCCTSKMTCNYHKKPKPFQKPCVFNHLKQNLFA